MKRLVLIFLLLSTLLNFACSGKKEKSENLSVLVFITGVIAGSPTYEMMAEGALEFAQENENVNIKIYEAGMNQSQWEQQLAEIIAEGNYDIVIGSNPSLPEICANVARMFPEQKFIITDSLYEGHPQIKTYLYNQYEQSLLLGYLAGLITNSNMLESKAKTNRKKIGFIAAQEYPLLTRHMVPGFIEGAQMVDPEIELDFRVIGSWGDANKAAELTIAMMNSGVDVFTSIAGGAAQGLIKSASERGAYIVWYNTNAYNLAPGVIVGCGIMEQKKLVMEILKDVLEDNVQYGVSETLGVRDGYLGFIFDDDGFRDYIPEDIQEKLKEFVDNYRNN